MPKACVVTVDRDILSAALGIDWRWTIVAAQMDLTAYPHPQLQLVLTGEDLPDVFTIHEGTPIRKAMLVIHRAALTADVVPVENA